MWSLKKWFRKEKDIHFFCAGHVDFIVMQSIIKNFSRAKIVAKDKKTKNELSSFGIDSIVYPTFPDILVMPRHTASKFPEPKMIKIGLRHGAYHFKDFVKAARYHAFDVFFVTSQREVELAMEKGIMNTVGIGFPKIDPLFDGSIRTDDIIKLKSNINIKEKKPIILFTATWNRSGMSAIELWIDRIAELSEDYNVLVTVHQWTQKHLQEKIEKTNGIHFIKDKNILPYLMLADVMIADTSSIIAEFCALDKPIITFRVPDGKRASAEIKEMLSKISIRVDDFNDLKLALMEALKNPSKLADERKKYNKIMFDELDGKAGKRAADYIKNNYLVN